MEALIQYWKDRYTPEELVQHLNIPMDDLTYLLADWIRDNLDKFREDVEFIYGIGDDEYGLEIQ